MPALDINLDFIVTLKHDDDVNLFSGMLFVKLRQSFKRNLSLMENYIV